MNALASPSRPAWASSACGRLRHSMTLGVWYGHDTLTTIGGRRFAARLHEIARGEDGQPALAYDCRAVEHREGAFEYRLREYADGEAKPEPRKKRARARIEELARENAALKLRLAQLEGRPA